MITIKHPTLKGHTREVRERDVDEWLAAGWLLNTPPAVEPEPEPVEDEADPQNSPKRQPRKG